MVALHFELLDVSHLGTDDNDAHVLSYKRTDVASDADPDPEAVYNQVMQSAFAFTPSQFRTSPFPGVLDCNRLPGFCPLLARRRRVLGGLDGMTSYSTAQHSTYSQCPYVSSSARVHLLWTFQAGHGPGHLRKKHHKYSV